VPIATPPAILSYAPKEYLILCLNVLLAGAIFIVTELVPFATTDVALNVGVVALGIVVSANVPLALALPGVYLCPAPSVTEKLYDILLLPSELWVTVCEPDFNVTVA
jgi:hypothetical protein